MRTDMKRKRLVTLAGSCLCMLCVMFCAGAMAEDFITDNGLEIHYEYAHTNKSYLDADRSYITVDTAEELRYVAERMDEVNAKIAEEAKVEEDKVRLKSWAIRLGADIDFQNVQMEAMEFPYAAFDGQKHTIRNVRVVDKRHTNVGLFQQIGNLKNLTIDGISVTAGKAEAQIGAVAGYVVTSTWENVHVKNAALTADNASGAYLGGLAGNAYGKKVNCTVEDITITSKGANVKNVGGLFGYLCVEKDPGFLEIQGCAAKNVTINVTTASGRNTVAAGIGRVNDLAGGMHITDMHLNNVLVNGKPSPRPYGDYPSQKPAEFTVVGDVFTEAPSSDTYTLAAGYEYAKIDEGYIIGKNIQVLDGDVIGGSFAFDPAKYLPANYAVQKNPDGSFSVRESAIAPAVTPNVPKTGDGSTPMLWLAMMLLSAAGMALVCRRGRRV